MFSKNRDQLLEHEVVKAFFTEVTTPADKAWLMSKEHFSVDGTLIHAWASQKAFKSKEGSDDQAPSGLGRTIRHGICAVSQVVNMRIEEHFGLAKTMGRIRQTVYRGLKRLDQRRKLTTAAANLVRVARMPIAVPQRAST